MCANNKNTERAWINVFQNNPLDFGLSINKEQLNSAISQGTPDGTPATNAADGNEEEIDTGKNDESNSEEGNFPGLNIIVVCLIFIVFGCVVELEGGKLVYGMLWKSDPSGKKWDLRCAISLSP